MFPGYVSKILTAKLVCLCACFQLCFIMGIFQMWQVKSAQQHLFGRLLEMSRMTSAKQADSVYSNLLSSQAQSVSVGAVLNSILGLRSYFAGVLCKSALFFLFIDISVRVVHLKKCFPVVTNRKQVFQADLLLCFLTSFISKARESFSCYRNHIMSVPGKHAKKPNYQKAVFPPDINIYI